MPTAPTTFPALSPTTVGAGSRLNKAQRYLATAYDAVARMFETTYTVLRSSRDAVNGQLTEAEKDVFRSAIVFAGAGVDTVLKEALRSCVEFAVSTPGDAKDAYVTFVTRQMRSSSNGDQKALAQLLIEPNPSAVLLTSYIESMTGSSLQSLEQVQKSLTALGLKSETDLYRSARDLNELFKARNEIAHEMDMTRASQGSRGTRSRNVRTITASITMCHNALEYCQTVLNRLEATVNAA